MKRVATPVDPSRELLITDLSVVEDPVRTQYRPGVPAGPQGAWSFGRLIENMAGPRSPSEFVLDLLAKWERDEAVNGFVSPARPGIRTLLTDPWLVASGCAPGATACNLDFTKAPFRLTAIVNRIDKRDLPDGSGNVTDAGEGRFVFNVLGATGAPLNFTVIFEYQLPARTTSEVLAWGYGWHLLSSFPFGPQYNAILQGLTERFSGRNVAPTRPNGSALNALRTNEVSLAATNSDPTNPPSNKLWEIRSFSIGANGLLKQDPVAQTPALAFNGSAALGEWLNANAAAVLAGTHQIPPAWLDAASPIPFALAWTAPGVADPQLVSQFAINTCSGCHRPETGATFVHIGKRLPGEAPVLSTWLTTVDVPRRVQDLERLLNVTNLAQAGDTGAVRTGRGH